MAQLALFYRLIVRPLFREPVRLALMVVAVALGVAVVLAIDLAGDAAAGSFHSSLETLAGDNDLEIVASGGVPESSLATLAAQPYPLRLSPRMEDFAVDASTQETIPLIGLDLIAEGSRYVAEPETSSQTLPQPAQSLEQSVREFEDPASVWVSPNLAKNVGDHISLLINDRTLDCTVRGILPANAAGGSAILMDIAAAQAAVRRSGRVDRILVKLPPNSNVDDWRQRLRGMLPAGIEVRLQGEGTEENRKMLAAFRWNLRLLSYIALIVGAFLIYNTISVSVVRRRAEIGIVRALGAQRFAILGAFLGEAACLGLAGALLGLPLGRLMASGAVKLMALTVESLYVSSRPGSIELTPRSVALALLVGIGVAVLSALAPAREAMLVAPVDAMALGRREFVARVHKKRGLLLGGALAVVAGIVAQLPPISGKPLFGYLASLLMIAAAACAMPAIVYFLCGMAAALLRGLLGVEGLLASRSLAASLRRTSVLVAALSTAVAMMVSVGIMVGSFRQTVVTWMNGQLPADLYVRPAGDPAADRHPTISLDLTEAIARIPGVDSVDRLRAYEISYQGMPATLASVDMRAQHADQGSDFFSGRATLDVLNDLRGKNNAIVSEPFTYKHKVRTGDIVTLPLGSQRVDFRIIDVYYDYTSERGNILVDRDVLQKYLPDPEASNLAIFVAPGYDPLAVRKQIQAIAAGSHLLIFSDREIRSEAVRIFDRTFAITYALEGVAVIVAVMGIAGALIALAIDRRRELGLLRFLGSSAQQIRKMILVEAGILGLLANLAGFVLGYFLSLVLVFVINKQSFGWTIRFHWPVAVLLGALSFVYVATILAGLYPARVAVRMNPLEVIHEE